MLRILFVCGLLFATPVLAQEVIDNTLNDVEISAEEDNIFLEDILDKQIPELPLCDNKVVLDQVQILLDSYSQKHPVESLYEKRQRALQLKLTKEYEEESPVDFTSKKDQVVADKLLMTKINQHLTDNQIRLCKSKAKISRFTPVYLMMYRNSLGQLQIFVLNFSKDNNEELTTVIE